MKYYCRIPLRAGRGSIFNFLRVIAIILNINYTSSNLLWAKKKMFSGIFGFI